MVSRVKSTKASREEAERLHHYQELEDIKQDKKNSSVGPSIVDSRHLRSYMQRMVAPSIGTLRSIVSQVYNPKNKGKAKVPVRLPSGKLRTVTFAKKQVRSLFAELQNHIVKTIPSMMRRGTLLTKRTKREQRSKSAQGRSSAVNEPIVYTQAFVDAMDALFPEDSTNEIVQKVRKLKFWENHAGITLPIRLVNMYLNLHYKLKPSKSDEEMKGRFNVDDALRVYFNDTACEQAYENAKEKHRKARKAGKTKKNGEALEKPKRVNTETPRYHDITSVGSTRHYIRTRFSKAHLEEHPSDADILESLRGPCRKDSELLDEIKVEVDKIVKKRVASRKKAERAEKSAARRSARSARSARRSAERSEESESESASEESASEESESEEPVKRGKRHSKKDKSD